MNINRNNYEECFLLYVDNELNAVEREAVEVFVMQNADLRGELNMLQETVLRADKKVSFINKAELMKSSVPANPVNESNYEEYFILYGDDELSNEEKDFVEQFVYRHPQHQSAFELLQEIRLTADTSIVFPDKQSLYRSEKDERVIVMRWWKIAAAAVVLLFLGVAAWMYVGNKGVDKTNPIAGGINNPAGKAPETIKAPKNITESLAQTNDQPTKKSDELNPEQIKATQKTTKSPDQPERILIAEIKSTIVSNNPEGPNVPHTDGTVAMVKPETIEPAKQIIDVEKTFTELSEDDPKSGQATYASNTTVSNKNKMRGFFRKVGRVVDKATNIGPTDEREDKKGIRIASFQIALK
jgi:hypothetical protein